MVCDDMMGSCVTGVVRLQSGRCTLVRAATKDHLFQMIEIIAKILRSLANPRRITKWISSNGPFWFAAQFPASLVMPSSLVDRSSARES
jgi:hypothetical protein